MLLSTAAWLLASLPSLPLRQEGFEAERARARTQLVERLLVLADWCQEQQLFDSRDKSWRAVLRFDRDNPVARKGLRYARNSDGSWKDPGPRPVKDRNPEMALELIARRSAAIDPYREAVFGALERYGSEKALRRASEDEILWLDPEDAHVRALHHERKLEGVWVLEETWMAKQRRADIKEFARQALADVPPPKPIDASPSERDMGIAWRTCLESGGVRVLATGEAEEAQRALSWCAAATPFLARTLHAELAPPAGWTAVLLANAGEWQSMASKWPGVNDELRKFYQQVVGTLLPDQQTVVYWDKDPAKRVDGVARQTVQRVLADAYGVGFDQGWLYEGFGLYLNRELTGSRLTWFIRFGDEAQIKKERERLMRPDTNWMNEAKKLLERPDHPHFAASLARDVNAMGIGEMLYAYALAAYMLEGRPGEVADLLSRAGRGKEPVGQALTAVTGLDLDDLESRLLRWLEERH